jgi:sigma-E factor negative regulatory protein RseA
MKPEISALMDGELGQADAKSLIASLQQDKELRHCWSIYHQIGDSLRREHVPDQRLQEKIFSSLAAEPTILAPHKASGGLAPKIVLALAASLATVSVVSWVGLQSTSASAPQTVAIAIPPAPVVQENTQPLTVAPVLAINTEPPAPANVQDYLFAHQELSPASGVIQASLGSKR